MNIKPIKTRKDYLAAVKRLEIILMQNREQRMVGTRDTCPAY
jgi:hypothetical protein